MEPEKPDPRLRARRVALVIVIASFFGILGGLSVFLAQVEGYWTGEQIVQLPAPSEAFLTLAKVVRSPAGLSVMALAVFGFAVVIHQGRADAWLKRLTILAVILACGVVTLFVAAVYVPWSKVQQ